MHARIAVSLLTVTLAACGGSSPSGGPSGGPSGDPTVDPRGTPTVDPGNDPTIDPGNDPTVDPGGNPTVTPPAPAPEAAVTTQWGPVSAPSFPAAVCTTLAATLTPTAGSLDPVDAVSTRSQPDRARLQAAIDGCPAGKAVRLVTGAAGASAFLTGPLTLRSGVTLWIDGGVTLFASRNPTDYENGAGARKGVGPWTCGTALAVDPNSCSPLILASGTVDAGIVGDGVIDGRAGSVLTAGPNAGLRTWWDVAWQSKLGLNQQNPRLIQVTGGRRFTLHRITIQNSPNFHVVTSGVAGVTAWGVKILSPSAVYARPGYACPAGTTPPERYSTPTDVASYTGPATCFTPDTVKNTDGFDPANSTSVLLAYSYVSVGDDEVAIKAGSAGASVDLTFSHDHFYYGHGMSMGSETSGGIRNVRVEDLSMDGQDASLATGLQIKSDSTRGGAVTNVVYERVCMRRMREPLKLNPFYSSKTGTLVPSYTGIVVRGLHSLGSPRYGAGTLTLQGYSAAYPLGLTLDGVVLDGGAPKITASDADLVVGPGPVSFAAALGAGANGVTVTGTAGTGAALDCAGAFPTLSAVAPTAPF